MLQVDDHQKDDEEREGDSEDDHRQEQRDHWQAFQEREEINPSSSCVVGGLRSVPHVSLGRGFLLWEE